MGLDVVTIGLKLTRDRIQVRLEARASREEFLVRARGEAKIGDHYDRVECGGPKYGFQSLSDTVKMQDQIVPAVRSALWWHQKYMAPAQYLARMSQRLIAIILYWCRSPTSQRWLGFDCRELRRFERASRGNWFALGWAVDHEDRRIVESERVPLKPMSVADAIDALDRSRSGAVVFRNPDTERVNVIYHRPDGTLGLIEPEA